MLEGFTIGFSIVALLLAIGAVALGAYAIVEVLAFKRSTHNIQYVPLDEQNKDVQEFDVDEEKFREMMEKANAEFMQPPMQNEVI